MVRTEDDRANGQGSATLTANHRDFGTTLVTAASERVVKGILLGRWELLRMMCPLDVAAAIASGSEHTKFLQRG